MPILQIINHFSEIQPLILQQHQQVIHQIRCLVGQFKAVMYCRCQCGFHPFFTHFLRNAFGAAGIQFGGVGGFRVGRFAFGEQLFQLIQKQPLVSSFAEAAAGAFMAGWSDRIRQYQ